ncbi:MAG: DJ-1/PfpI family protein [Alphaproteobacteria bacterium]
MSPIAASPSVLILVANGVDEVQLTEVQRALTKAGLKFCTVAPEQGLVNSWHDNAWGHYFPVDRGIGEVLGSDFDALVLPGGTRSATKLKQNLHTRRLVNHFLDADKPVAAIGAGVGLLALGTRIGGRTVAAEVDVAAELVAVQIQVAPEAVVTDRNLHTAQGPEPIDWIEGLLEQMDISEDVKEAA